MYIHSVYKNQSMKAILSKLREKIKSNCELVKVKKGCTKWYPIIKRAKDGFGIWLICITGHWVYVNFSYDYFPDSSSLQCFDEFFYKKMIWILSNEVSETTTTGLLTIYLMHSAHFISKEHFIHAEKNPSKHCIDMTVAITNPD